MCVRLPRKEIYNWIFPTEESALESMKKVRHQVNWNKGFIHVVPVDFTVYSNFNSIASFPCFRKIKEQARSSPFFPLVGPIAWSFWDDNKYNDLPSLIFLLLNFNNYCLRQLTRDRIREIIPTYKKEGVPNLNPEVPHTRRSVHPKNDQEQSFLDSRSTQGVTCCFKILQIEQ